MSEWNTWRFPSEMVPTNSAQRQTFSNVSFAASSLSSWRPEGGTHTPERLSLLTQGSNFLSYWMGVNDGRTR
jgi:hypothetical protein